VISFRPRPPRMHRQNRQPDPVFAPDESLYHRVPHSHAELKEALKSSFQFPQCCVNRSKYSEPYDVLFDGPDPQGYQVVSWQVRQVTGIIEPVGDSATYECLTKHLPEELNFAHTELQTYKQGDRSKMRSPSPGQKLFWRALMAERATLWPHRNGA